MIVIQGTPFHHSRQCGLEACLSSHRISHFLFFPSYLFIYLSFFLIPVYLLGIVQGPFVSLHVSQPPLLPTTTSPSSSSHCFSASAEKRDQS